MTHSIRLGNIRGIPVGAHWSLGLFGALVASNLARFFFPEFAPGLPQAMYIIASIAAALLLAVSILAHELGHALIARRGGVRTEDITLWLLGGIARLDSEPRTARHAFEIAVAGPLVSMALGLAASTAAFAAWLAGVPSLVVALLMYVGVVNAMLAIFNLVPALPLDGGRALQAWRWSRNGDSARATIDAARIGRLIGLGMIGLGLVQVVSGVGTGLWTALIGLFVMSQAGRERRRAERVIAARTRPTIDPFAFLQEFLTTRPSRSTADRPPPVDADLIVLGPESSRVREA